MPTTPNGLVTPPLTGADPNIPRDFLALANSVDALYGKRVANAAALPVSGAFEGQKIYLQDVDADAQWNGAAWIYDTAWVQPTLGNSWVSYDSGSTFEIPAYTRIGGVVHLKGLMKSGTSSAAFTLPPGYRPLKFRYFTCAASPGTTCVVSVAADGTVNVAAYASGGTNAYVSIELSFVAEQ